MSTEKFFSEQADVPQKEQHFTAAGQINVRCGRIRLSATPASGPYEVVLPPVAQAQGRFYSVVCRNADAVNAITLTHDDDSECWPGDITFNGKCDRALLYSDGQIWLIASTLTFTGTTEPPTSAPTTAAVQ
jgi:hypothetical protein